MIKKKKSCLTTYYPTCTWFHMTVYATFPHIYYVLLKWKFENLRSIVIILDDAFSQASNYYKANFSSFKTRKIQNWNLRNTQKKCPCMAFILKTFTNNYTWLQYRCISLAHYHKHQKCCELSTFLRAFVFLKQQ